MSCVVAVLLIADCGAGSPAAPASFLSLEGIEGGSAGFAVSADGGTVVGAARPSSGALRWLPRRGTTTLTTLAAVACEAQGVSPDGQIIVGHCGAVNAGPAFRRQPDGPPTALAALAGAQQIGAALGASSDGARIVGWSQDRGLGATAVLWDASDVATDLIETEPGSWAVAITPNGRVVVGNMYDATGGMEPFRWDGTSIEPLGDVAGGTNASVANAVSADGASVCGQTRLATGLLGAFCWTARHGMQLLPTPPGFESIARSVNHDGSVVVGTIDGEAVIWDENRVQTVAARLHQAGIDLSPALWTLWEANAITPNGRSVAGSTISPDGREVAWIATLP
ncbi:MAG: hypothetical protein ABI629_12500 [bacterium]